MRVLVTGATGLIGKELGKRLVQDGHEIVVPTRDPERARTELPYPAEFHRWTSSETEFPRAALRGVEAIIHLAGEPVADGRWTEKQKKKIYDSRVHSTRHIVKAIQDLQATEAVPLKVWVQGSAIGYYGSREDEVLDESSKPGGDFLAGVCKAWEAEADTVTNILPNVRVAKVRTGLVFARNGGALAKMIPLFARGLGGRLALGQQWMSWIHIDDIVNVFAFALENKNVQGVVNGVAPEAVRNERFTTEFARALKRPVFLPVPELALKAVFGEMAIAVLGSQRVLPKRLEDLGFKFKFPEFVPAIHDIGVVFENGQHELVAEQWVPRTPEQIFPFFSSETNLEELTPPFLGFKVIGKDTPSIRQGTIIDYRLSLHGVPMKWKTRIESWIPNREFIDNQLSGPYQKWHHTHQFIELAGGTLMRDRVSYKLPLGFLGDLGASWKVDRDVATIFKFRRKKIDEMFGRSK